MVGLHINTGISTCFCAQSTENGKSATKANGWAPDGALFIVTVPSPPYL